jgi:aspartyl/asparaginyl-tRNA synthetase
MSVGPEHRSHLQVLDVLERMFTDIFAGIEKDRSKELQIIGQQFPYEPFVMKPMRFTFAAAVQVCHSHPLQKQCQFAGLLASMTYTE